MQHVRNQHIVPEFLLKNFSDDGLKIWTFDKSAIQQRWNEVKLRSISTTPTNKYFYDRTAGTKLGSLEYNLRDIEDQASSLISKLIIQKNLEILSEEDKIKLSLFLATQSFRTIGGLGDVQYVNQQLKDFIEPHGVDTSSLDPRSTWLDIIESSNEFIKHFLNKSWSLIISKSEFYISDNPFTRNNTTHVRQNRGNLGFDSKGIEIYLPLSSSVTLCLYCKETFPYNNTVFEAQSENVEYLNWLQVKYSNRFIYSHNSNFELIYDMLAKNDLG